MLDFYSKKGSVIRAALYIIALTLILFTIIVLVSKPSFIIHDRPILFSEHRIALSKEYIHDHYDLNVSSISIVPKMIVIHWTQESDFNKSLSYFYNEEIPDNWGLVSTASKLNVSAHFLVDREGKVFRLMPETRFARHVIGLNMHAIGIENVGGEEDLADLTQAQLQANIDLVHYLKERYPKIEYVIAHKDYTNFTDSALWMEKDQSYRTQKADVDDLFMSELYTKIEDLHLKRDP